MSPRTEQQLGRFIVEGPSRADDSDAMTERLEPGMRTGSGCCRARRWPACWPTTRRWRAGPTSWSRTLPDLDAAHPLPQAPWFPPGASWSARRVLLHIMAETAQHAGHADIIREALDGAKTMG